MPTSEKRKEMKADMPEMQALISQRIREQNYREMLKEVTTFPWSTDDPCVYRTASGNLWIAAGHVTRKTDTATFCYKNFICTCLVGNDENGIMAYMDLQTAAWKGIELVAFSSHADGLSALYGERETNETNDRELLYRFFGRNYVCTVGFLRQDEKEQAAPGDKIFIASIDTVGFGKVDEDGKLAVIDRVMTYEQAFDDEELKPMWGVFAMKLFTLKWNGYREAAKDRRALGILLHDTMKLCGSMEVIAELDDQKRKYPERARMNPRMVLLKNKAAIEMHNRMDEKVKNNLPLLEWAVNQLPDVQLQEFNSFISTTPKKENPTSYENLMWLEGMLKVMERLFGKAAEEENKDL